ncbi:unnamed protein product [Linum tenue]|uniref:Uncharacterized protein n=1 Tax=Linum tenue TaxID=586396 RepID=A0AAV0K142_9ROSI|nr:unnamed protein product [Linum tenue]
MCTLRSAEGVDSAQVMSLPELNSLCSFTI